MTFGLDIPTFKFALNDGLDESFLPTRGDSRSTGWDVKAAETVVIKPTQTVKIPLGIRCFAPYGYWLELRPRSSTFGNKQLSALYGVIDESYEGELLFACQWIPSFQYFIESSSDLITQPYYKYELELVIEKGERIGQLLPIRRQEMEVESVSADEFARLSAERGLKRGSGGFGSTGK